MFVGLPASGKSTLIARLLRLEGVDEMLRACGSTGVMNDIIIVNIAEDEASIHAASIDEKSCEWQKVEFGISCLRQMGVKFFMIPETNSAEAADSDHEEAEVLATFATTEENLLEPEPTFSGLEATLSAEATVSDPEPHERCIESQSKPSVEMKQLTADAMADIEELLQKEGFSAVRPFLENKSTLYLSDTGN